VVRRRETEGSVGAGGPRKGGVGAARNQHEEVGRIRKFTAQKTQTKVLGELGAPVQIPGGVHKKKKIGGREKKKGIWLGLPLREVWRAPGGPPQL